MSKPIAAEKYQTEYADGFKTNHLLVHPKGLHSRSLSGRTAVYSAISDDSIMIQGDRFLPTWDDTDHLQFVCGDCETVSHVLRVEFDGNYSRPPPGKDPEGYPRYAVFFYLGCPGCGKSGQRKVYLDRFASIARYQSALNDGKLLLYGNKSSPELMLEFHHAEFEAKGEIHEHNADGLCSEQICDKKATHYFAITKTSHDLRETTRSYFIALCADHYHNFPWRHSIRKEQK